MKILFTRPAGLPISLLKQLEKKQKTNWHNRGMILLDLYTFDFHLLCFLCPQFEIYNQNNIAAVPFLIENNTQLRTFPLWWINVLF